MLSINIADVIKVLELCKPYLIGLGIVIALGAIAMIVCLKLPKAQKYLIRTQAGIAMALALVLVVNLICFGPMSTLISLATGEGSISADSAADANALSAAIAEEGIVLLKNEGGALPLGGGKKLNVFGWASTNPVYGGTGSGGISDAYDTVTLLDSLINAGFELNQDLIDFYTGYRGARPTVGMWGQDWTIPEPTLEEYGAANVFENAKDFSDTALIVISRSGGEGADLPNSLYGEDSFVEDGVWGSYGVRHSSNPEDLNPEMSYLELTVRERAMVEQVTGDYENVVVLINAANPMELGWLEEYPSIKAAVSFAGPGQTGFAALGKILNGTVNPSGRTVDTFVYDLAATPAYNNTGWFAYDNMDEFYVEMEGDGWTPFFVNYAEGIYVGYKFYETAAAEGLLEYGDVVQYPFGYGLSYTTFTQEMGAIVGNSGTLSFDVTVTNTGAVAGKDVVEVYYNPPYTNGGIEKASANLIAFDKTGLLQPGASETVTISIQIEDMASYDAKGAGCYVLEAGDYGISIRSDSHTIIDEQTYTVDGTVTYSDGRASDAAPAVNQFDGVEGDVTYLSRADGFANYGTATAYPDNFSMPEEDKARFLNNANYDTADYDDPNDTAPILGAKNGMTLADLRGADYGDPAWETLLDQLTAADMNTLISLGGYQTSAVTSVGKIQTVDCDGPASINNNFTGKSSIGFPAAAMIAATWNTDLAEAFGESIGRMADEMGVSGWYAPAMNIHRSAFGGRNFEYYSEDGLLSGRMASGAIRGARTHGVYAYMKHFALNDQENARDLMLCTWADEQTIREVYLKPFELAVKEGGCQAVMSSYNYIGTEWAGGCAALLQNVLRGEWGFQGMVLTDYYSGMGYMDAEQGIRNGNDICLAPYDSDTNNIHDQTGATSLLAMRRACKNILYTVVNSRAYDPANLSSGPQGWQIAAIAIDVAVVLGLAALELLVVRKGYARRKENERAAGVK